ncbi:MAG TPA: hypothetical protein VI318_22690 [Baekduia sp.]
MTLLTAPPTACVVFSTACAAASGTEGAGGGAGVEGFDGGLGAPGDEDAPDGLAATGALGAGGVGLWAGVASGLAAALGEEGDGDGAADGVDGLEGDGGATWPVPISRRARVVVVRRLVAARRRGVDRVAARATGTAGSVVTDAARSAATRCG